jgi:hypothetical protein
VRLDHSLGTRGGAVTSAPVCDQISDGAEVRIDGQLMPTGVEAIKRANADLDDTIRQLGELGLLGRPASQETLAKLSTALDHAHTARARLGEAGDGKIIGPDEIDELSDPAEQLAAWRRLITDTVRSVTVAPTMTADGRRSHLWDPRRIDISYVGQHP